MSLLQEFEDLSEITAQFRRRMERDHDQLADSNLLDLQEATTIIIRCEKAIDEMIRAVSGFQQKIL